MGRFTFVGTEKRRPESRTRSKRAKPQIGRQPKDYHWVPEALAIIFGSAATFILVSILVQQSFVAESFNLGENPGRTFGPVGSFVGVLLFGAFGWSSMMFVAWLAFLAVRAWREELVLQDKSHPTWILIAGSLGIIVSSASLCAIIGGNLGGGDVGQLLAGPLTTLFSKPGAIFATSAIFVLAVSFTLGRSLVELASMVWDFVTDGAVLLFVTLPLLILNGSTWCFRQLVNAVALVLEAMFAPEVVERFRNVFGRPEKEKKSVTVKPSVRKNVIRVEEDEVDEDEDDDLDFDEEEYEVQVNRRSKDDKVSMRELQKVRKKLEEESPAADIFYTGTYSPPEITLLAQGQPAEGGEDDEDLVKKSRQIETKLKDFGILGRVTEVHPGPVITLFEFEPAAGVKVGRIAALSDDLSMTLRAVSVRIVAPIPGKGTVGIEVPNKNREVVRLRDVLESQECVRATSSLTIGLGKDTYGNAVVADIAKMPHLLIAGATGTGKSVCINAILLSLLYRATPADLGLIMIDPKILELSVYDGIPHLRVPVVTVPKQAKAVLEWAVHEMHRRYRLMQKLGVRSLDAYNRVVRGEEDPDADENDKKSLAEEIEVELTEDLVVDGSEAPETESSEDEEISTPGEQLIPMPKIVIVIDELADLMLTVGREVEDLITRLAQKARAAGIHLIVATQRPSVDVITGLIKANFPARLSFQVSSRVDSRTIIDGSGAEKLLGQGDMLFMPPGVGSLRRVHGAFVADAEVKRVVAQLKRDCKPVYDAFIQELCDKAMKEESEDGQNETGSDEHDDLYDQAVRIVLEKGKASTSLVQRHLRIGYNRAARIIEMMEREGLVGPADGAKPREVIGSGANDL
jgi:S-DNA-T family DNA segregation ATPase FtsK/SpoIIIE